MFWPSWVTLHYVLDYIWLGRLWILIGPRAPCLIKLDLNVYSMPSRVQYFTHA